MEGSKTASVQKDEARSSSLMQMVEEAKKLEEAVPVGSMQPDQEKVEGSQLPEEKVEEPLLPEAKDSSSSSQLLDLPIGLLKKLVEGSKTATASVEEDEASSSSWMQMAEVMKMFREAVQEMNEQEMEESLQPEKEVEGSQQTEENDSSSPKSGSSLPLELPKLFDEESGSLEQMSHKWIKGKESMEIEEKYSHSSWVVEMERILERKNPWMPEMKQWMRPSIYRVPEWLNSMTKREAYQPQVVSLGPFHHGERNLKPMEEHKHRLMLHMVKRSGKPLAQFIAAIKKVAERLQEAYDGLDEKWCGENTDRFVDVMVTDGAFLLEMMTCTSTGQVPSDYAPYDPIFSDHSILSLWAYIQSDMILVENQVPLLALQTLEAVRNNGTSPGNTYINKMVGNFVCPKLSKGNLPTEIIDVLGLHPLDVFHKCFCALSHTWSPDLKRSGQRETLMLSAAELREAGVHFKKSKTQSFRDIEFNKGVLSMPLVEIGDTSERMFLNLMAFERLHCSAGNDVTAYIIFMDNIIDSERDVALLKSKGVLKNFLSSDKAAAELFNSLGNGITLDPNSKICHVQWKVDMHCKKPWPKLQASFKHTYMRNPWVFISGVAAVILLSLTILQTIYTIMPFYKKN